MFLFQIGALYNLKNNHRPKHKNVVYEKRFYGREGQAFLVIKDRFRLLYFEQKLQHM